MYQRNIVANIKEAMTDSPVILLNGARQTGKSTLMQNLSEAGIDVDYVTMDDTTVLEAAKKDADAFLRGFTKSVIIDEIQRIPDLFVPLKATVDKYRKPGRFILTGSANIFMLPALSESLAGRMEILTLMTLSQGELIGKKEQFLSLLFSDKNFDGHVEPIDRKLLFENMLSGGFPEVISRNTTGRRNSWFNSYTTTILQRDVRDISNIQGLSSLPRLLQLLAVRTGKLINMAEISNSIGIPVTTLNRYLTLLEATFLVNVIQPWSENIGKRLIKTPKLYLNDTGLSAHLQGLTIDKLWKEPMMTGALTEHFVLLEIMKQQTWSDIPCKIFHYRTASGSEIDFILEDNSGRVAGVEVKSSSSVQGKDFKTLESLADELGDRFMKGVVFYTGERVVRFGEKLWAIPIQALWQL